METRRFVKKDVKPYLWYEALFGSDSLGGACWRSDDETKRYNKYLEFCAWATKNCLFKRKNDYFNLIWRFHKMANSRTSFMRRIRWLTLVRWFIKLEEKKQVLRDPNPDRFEKES